MRIYNTLTRTKEEFRPIKKGKIGMYVCGPTVYDEPHIGHARSAYIFDVIRKYLAYREYKVTFVRNVTDVDDKIINRASKDGRPVEEISKRYLESYHNDMALLGIAKPDKEPRATAYIAKMIKFIEDLIKKDRAYTAGGDVYFDIRKAKNYGKLSNQNLEKMESGIRVSPGENKKDPLDFALWKKAKDGEPSWDSPWGKGRPGWHIECSVMSSDILGDEFDIHGGGIDLIFPHHENEIAQSEGAGKKFARFWIHNGLLTINSEKMAKSLGNFVSIKDFMAKYKDADLLKLLFLSSHYRSPVDYTEEKIEEMRSLKERIVIFLRKIPATKDHASRITHDARRFTEAMDDDFNTPGALAAIFEMISAGNIYLTQDNARAAAGIKKTVSDFCAVLGISAVVSDEKLDSEVKKLIEARNSARRNKDFKKADEIRQDLLEKGVILEDTKEGVTWRKKV